MAKKSLKLLLSLLAIASMFIILSISANAYLVGDANLNGEITADDARLALRTAVKLDTMTEQQEKVADANNDGLITATDARIILRMSVNLEAKVHYYEKEVLSVADCTTNGKIKFNCTECDDVYEMDIDAIGHDWNIAEPTCTEDKYCKRDNCPTNERITKLGHKWNIANPTCTEDKYCTRDNCPTNERISKLGHTTTWGSCGNCRIFITEKYATQAATIKTKFYEAKTAFDAAYAINNYNTMLNDGISFTILENTKAALPNYVKAKSACEAALAACGSIPEFATIKTLLEKNIYNLTISIEEANKIITFCNGNGGKINMDNYDNFVTKLETHNAGFWNSSYKDHTVANNKKLVQAIVW